MITYKIKHKIVNCVKIESVMSHDLYPPPPVTNCHTFSDPLPPWSVTYFMDGPKGMLSISGIVMGDILNADHMLNAGIQTVEHIS